MIAFTKQPAKIVPPALDPDGDGKMGGAERTIPQVFYGPGDNSRVFQPDEEIPEGWEDHPRKVADFIDPLELTQFDL